MNLVKSLARATISRVIDRLDIVQDSVNRNDRKGAFRRAWGLIVTNQIAGDYIELGVFQGDSLVSNFAQYKRQQKWVTAQTTSAEAWRRQVWSQYLSEFKPRFWGFDTYEGMPANDEHNRTFAAGTFQTSYDLVQQKCHRAGLKEPQLSLVKGLFSNSSPSIFEGRKAAIIVLDGDLYASAVDGLALVRDTFQQGTILLADDYHCFKGRNDAGERKAMAEFSAQTGITFEPLFQYQFAGQAFICHMPE